MHGLLFCLLHSFSPVLKSIWPVPNQNMQTKMIFCDKTKQEAPERTTTTITFSHLMKGFRHKKDTVPNKKMKTEMICCDDPKQGAPESTITITFSPVLTSVSDEGSWDKYPDCWDSGVYESSDAAVQREPGAVQAVTRDFRTLYLHAGQFKCKFSDLVFDMKGEGRVMYQTVPWDSHVLKGLGHMEPAGPLYSIECSKGSIHRLHLPHCTDVVKLTVAHVTGGNVEMLQPLKITNTHVIIEVQNLSPFGLLKALLWPAYPIRAQVLLFFEKSLRKLHIHLLPGNVPVEEVQKRHENIRYITTSSKCELTPGKKYRPCCRNNDREYDSQPEDEKFERDYGPNYHPTFEVFLNTGVRKVTLSLFDENGLVVWKPRDVKLTGTQRAATSKHSPGADFVDKYTAELIQKVPSVMEIVDHFRDMGLTSEMYNKIHAEATTQDQMREFYNYLNSAGRAAKAKFYQILQQKHFGLVTELESGSGLD
ncbi:NACHT, LRR and PYD domains-containing protein 1b allele 2-like isoform X2 [Hemibagrus wyckioides]|uniref:NACHT, LRR and PYD domains-containing protein 1b allele 2-like isoform X2 n=1 Tax=Hemibagrus wyckioides TaxID=337641 RepID=UPI00266D3B17|nr:NACHT, LRR and PYD domains-containing protein 1b allele 2-like isoform X2 [Hemibagrus wyckioides]